MSISTYSRGMSGEELFYWRLDAWLTTVGDYNQVRGIFDKLDTWMPPEVENVFIRYYRGNPRIVADKYYELGARIERQWGAVMESISELGLACTDQDVKDFRSLARSTSPESKFRAKIREKVKRLYTNAVKARQAAAEGKPAKTQAIMTLRDLISWYQTPRPSSHKRK